VRPAPAAFAAQYCSQWRRRPPIFPPDKIGPSDRALTSQGLCPGYPGTPAGVVGRPSRTSKDDTTLSETWVRVIRTLASRRERGELGQGRVRAARQRCLDALDRDGAEPRHQPRPRPVIPQHLYGIEIIAPLPGASLRPGSTRRARGSPRRRKRRGHSVTIPRAGYLRRPNFLELNSMGLRPSRGEGCVRVSAPATAYPRSSAAAVAASCRPARTARPLRGG